ncbi:MAG: T9SS type A sorting domain-containing protein [Candidatus Cloacimonetes bacterium]|nr:T9SS type A sorting domain-containing protein [Candidatus Cloacimonadota bacterium]
MRRAFLILLTTIIGALLFADGVQPFGTGLEGDPYQIATLDNLLWMSTNEIALERRSILTADIDASETINWNNGKGFLPIGNQTTGTYAGHFDGQNHVISNLYINNPDLDQAVGLFGLVYRDKRIINLGLVDAQITGYRFVGGIAGRGDSLVLENCFVTGTISGYSNVGGLAGHCKMVINCHAEVDVNATYSLGILTGGCWAYQNSYYNTELSLCNGYNFEKPGAIPAEIFNEWISNGKYIDIDDYLTSDGELYLINSIADFELLKVFGISRGFGIPNDYNFKLTSDLDFSNNPNSFIPFLASDIDGDNHTISNVSITLPPDLVIKGVGLFGIANNCTLENINVSNISITALSASNVGAIVGLYGSSELINCSSQGSIVCSEYGGGLIGTGSGSIENCYSSVDVTSESAGGLCSEGTSLGNINSFYNYESVLINDEHRVFAGALSNQMFTTWLNNDKTLDINDYLIIDEDSYLISDISDFKAMLAFCNVEDRSFKLVNDLDFANEPNLYLPTFRGNFDGNQHTVSNLFIDSTLYNSGFIGTAYHASIKNLGVIGFVSSSGIRSGSLIASSYYSTIYNCYTIDAQLEGRWVGGLFGVLTESDVSNCFADAEVSGQSAGSLCFSFSQCNVSDCYSMGSVTGIEAAGGFAAYYQGDYIKNCYTLASVELIANELNSSIGGFLGTSWGSIEHCVWNGEISDLSDGISNGGEEDDIDLINVTSQEMQTRSTYTDIGWDFYETWRISPECNGGYPFLLSLWSVVGYEGDPTPFIDKTYLKSAYPNPFNPDTTIEFNVMMEEKASLTIFNIRGQVVKDYPEFDSGKHSVVWSGDDKHGKRVASGVYFYRLKTQTVDVVKKMIMIK